MFLWIGGKFSETVEGCADRKSQIIGLNNDLSILDYICLGKRMQRPTLLVTA